MATAAKYYMAHANGGTDVLNVAKYLSNFKDISRQQVRHLVAFALGQLRVWTTMGNWTFLNPLYAP